MAAMSLASGEADAEVAFGIDSHAPRGGHEGPSAGLCAATAGTYVAVLGMFGQCL